MCVGGRVAVQVQTGGGGGSSIGASSGTHFFTSFFEMVPLPPPGAPRMMALRTFLAAMVYYLKLWWREDLRKGPRMPNLGSSVPPSWGNSKISEEEC